MQPSTGALTQQPAQFTSEVNMLQERLMTKTNYLNKQYEKCKLDVFSNKVMTHEKHFLSTHETGPERPHVGPNHKSVCS